MKKGILFACLVSSLAWAQQPPSEIGQWSASQAWPDVAVHSALLPDGKVFWFPYTDKARIWDPATNTHSVLPGIGYNPFCAGHSFLGDGRLMLVSGHIGGGGVGEPKASIFDPVSGSFLRVADINAGRWYPTVLTMPNGDATAISGMINQTFGLNKVQEVWEAGAGRWRQLTGAAEQVIPMYPRAHVMPDGRIFVVGPNVITQILDTAGTGKWTRGPFRLDRSRDNGASVQYVPGKVLYSGGGDPAMATTELFDMTVAMPTVRFSSPMPQGRRQHHLTMLPDGRVLATHGSTGSGFDNKATPPLPASVWDPVTERWSVWATPNEFRGYHHTALLLPDGRILAAGADQHLNAEIYSPPYLFQGARPVITAAPAGVPFAQPFTFTTPDAAAVQKVTLIGLSSVSHSLNTGQNFVSLAFTRGAGQITATAPASGFVVPPGYYMLFILNGQNVPSVAKFVRVGGTSVVQPPQPAPAAPSALAMRGVTANQVDIGWTDGATNEMGTKIERRIGTGAWMEIGSVGPNIVVYSNTGLTPATPYGYRVRAFNSGGNSAFSNEVSVTTAGLQTTGGQTLMADYFTDNVLDTAKWRIGTIAGGVDVGAVAFDPAILVREINARVEIKPRAGVVGDHFAGYVSKTAWNLTNASAKVEVVAAPATGVTTQFALCLDMQNYLSMAVVGPTLIVDQVADGDRETSGIPYDVLKHRFWTIRHGVINGVPQVSFQVSGDGVVWTTLRTEAPEFPVSGLFVEISAGTTESIAVPGTVIFDRVMVFTNTTTITQPSNQPPVSNPGGPYDGLVGSPVNFDGSRSTDSDGAISSYAWTFGDGGTATGATTSHVYLATGYYEARLTVTDNKGATATESVSISVNPAQSNLPPVARPGGPYSAAPGVAIAFNGSASNDPDGSLWSWDWDFGDGTAAAGINVTHAYTTPGTYTARLTVTDNVGSTASATAIATISGSNQPPVARTSGPYSGKVNIAVAFSGSLSSDPDGTIASYAWNFGNGATGTGASPSHTYTAVGSYTVTLTVTDNKGAANTTTTTAAITNTATKIILADDFNDNFLTSQKWNLGTTAATATAAGIDRTILVAERNQRLEIVPLTATTGERFFGIIGNGFDFTGCGARTEVPSVPSGNAEAAFSLFKDRQNFLQIRYKAGVLTFIQNALGVSEQSTVAYNPVQHRHWRILHVRADDSLRFETSPDGLAWTSQRTTSRKVVITLLYPEMSAGTNVSVPVSGTAAFDNFTVEK